MGTQAKSLLLSGLLFGSMTASACTIFCGVDRRGHMLAANTEDHRPNMRIYFKVRAATDSTFGFFGTTYNHPDGMLQGGSNDQGLFFDTNELGEVPVRKTAGTKVYNFPVDPGSYVLQHCKSVQEVIDFVNTYSLAFPAQIHVADKSGQMAIIINDTILRTPGKFQLTTNFHPLRHDIGVYPCWRYDTVSQLIAQKGVSLASFEEAMFATTRHENTMTIYSNMGDLTTGDWTYYAYGYKGSAYRFNIHELLKDGDKTVLLRDLLPGHPYLKYYALSQAKGTGAAMAAWKKDRATYSTQERYEIPKVMIWNYLFWETNYAAADSWLDAWWDAVKKPGAEDWMTKSLVQLMRGRQPEARTSLEQWRALTPESETAKYYLAFLDQQYEKEGKLTLKLPGYKEARVVSVGGLSYNPNYYLMHPTADGWEITIDAEAGYKTYYFLVDGQKTLDPRNPVKQVIPTLAGPEEMNILKVE